VLIFVFIPNSNFSHCSIPKASYLKKFPTDVNLLTDQYFKGIDCGESAIEAQPPKCARLKLVLEMYLCPAETVLVSN